MIDKRNKRISAYALERNRGGTLKQVDREKSRRSSRRRSHRQLRIITDQVVGRFMLQRVEGIGTGKGSRWWENGNAPTGTRDRAGKTGKANGLSPSGRLFDGGQTNGSPPFWLFPQGGAACQWGEERIKRGGGGIGFPDLSKTLNEEIDRIDVMIRAHIAVAIRRKTTASALRCTDSIKS